MFPHLARSPSRNPRAQQIRTTTMTDTDSMNLDCDQVAPNETQKPTGNKPIQTGIERYITITEKRKRSPQAINLERAAKISRENNGSTGNYYSLLDNTPSTSRNTESSSTEISHKPPPIYIRQQSNSELVNGLKKIVGENNFYIVDLIRGTIRETKVQATKEVHYTQIVNWLDSHGKKYYTYQLKSAKGLRVVAKGIDSNVDPNEIAEDLKAQGFEVKSVHNIINKFKNPQPMFKIELTPESSRVAKGKTHPIYSLKYILNRKISVEEPYKRTTLVQCTNCQEFGHTKSYCKLTNVCVACGGLHPTSACDKDKNNPETRKCSNCNGNHTANYRGCPVFESINKRSNYARQSSQPHKTTKNSPSNLLAGNKSHTPHQLQTGPAIPSDQNPNKLSYAEAAKINLSSHDKPQQSEILQILLALTTNIQQLTNTMHQMQTMLSKQTELLTKLIKP